MMIKSPEDCPLARAPRIVVDSPQRRFFAARGLGTESLTRRRRGAPKEKEPSLKFQVPNSKKYYELRMCELRIGNAGA